MPSPGSLPANLAVFCRVLRTEHGFSIGPGELKDAARALDIAGISDEQRVRDALRPILATSRDEARQFDRAFTAFFFDDREGVTQPGQPPLDVKHAARPTTLRRRSEAGVSTAGDVNVAGAGEATDEPGEDQAVPSGAAYSPHPGLAGSERVPARRDRAWRDAARLFVRRLHVGLSRRWRPGLRGRRFDPRRTLRHSLHTGGEVLAPRWLHRLRRAPRLVVVIDGSRSMDRHAATALDMAVGLAVAAPRLEVFTFSTEVQRVTPAIRDVAAGRRTRIERLHGAWGGGTRIGASLLHVLAAIERRPGARDTVMLIVSDGLDVGEPTVLRQAMAGLARRSAAVIWLNPLLETAGYQPVAEGMRVARPYITTFASVGRPRDLMRLARHVRVRRQS